LFIVVELDAKQYSNAVPNAFIVLYVIGNEWFVGIKKGAR